jgi:hypothetical protein
MVIKLPILQEHLPFSPILIDFKGVMLAFLELRPQVINQCLAIIEED